VKHVSSKCEQRNNPASGQALAKELATRSPPRLVEDFGYLHELADW
jgi:hypothetical protein